MARHTFTPERYYTTMGSHPSVLRIAPGDTVVTTTVDSIGHDATGEPVTPGFNPTTGPFFVEGAELGDTLVVHLDLFDPNRPTGVSVPVLAPNVVDPEFVRHLPQRPLLEWTVDLARSGASLHTPVSGLEALRLPLEPMLGCFGVAPAHDQVISTVTAAEHGGNMDYRGFRAGATAYFPVFTPGALLIVGEGHAIQGDGEIAGAGIEMVRWLERDWKLDVAAASTLLSLCVEYDIGNVFDPAYTMICKLPKQVLQQLSAAR